MSHQSLYIVRWSSSIALHPANGDFLGSAGIGRTGSFIIVDAVSDALRREHMNQNTGTALKKPVSVSPAPETPGIVEPQPDRSDSQNSNSALNAATFAMNIDGSTAGQDRTEDSVNSNSFLNPYDHNPSVSSLPSVFSTSPGSFSPSPMAATKPSRSTNTEVKATKIAASLIHKKQNKMAMEIDPPEMSRNRPISPTGSASSASRSVVSGRSAISGRSNISGRSGRSGYSGASGFASGSASLGSGSVENIRLPPTGERDGRFTMHRGSIEPSDSGSDLQRPSLTSAYGSSERMSSEA
jgi:hypothetical protein